METKTRLELFSDAIFAIIITIAVLEVPLPIKNVYHDFFISLLTFAISFFIIASYWNDHRKLFEKIRKVSDKLVFYNICFIFSFSLIPVFTKWSIERGDNSMPIVFFGTLLLLINFTFGRLAISVLKVCDMIPLSMQRYIRFFYIKELITYIFFIIVTVIAYWYPNIALILFIAMPIMNFIATSSGKRNEIENIPNNVENIK